MAISTRLDLRQQQNLVMTPQLQQSIKLLQMSAMDLQDFVETQLAENPLLAASGMEESASDSTSEKPDQDALAESLREAGEAAFQEQQQTEEDSTNWAKDHQFSDDTGLDNNDITNWQEGAAPGSAQEAGYWDVPVSRTVNYGDASNPLEQTVAEEQSLQDVLREQLQMAGLNPVQQMIGLYLIDALDEGGYLRESLSEAAAVLECSEQMIASTLDVLQSFEPAGVFARSLEECLALQLKEQGRFDPAMESLLANLELLGQGEWKKLAKSCEVSEEDVREMAAEIRTLNPKPGLAYEHEVIHAVKPDVTVIADGKGGWHIELNQDQLPKVLVDKHYYSTVSEQARTSDDKQYLSEQLNHANWLVKALDQRAKTMLAVATEIVKQQELFFKHGVRYMKPLTLKTVADRIEMHESTVSRVTTQKYLATPRGLFEMKYFFTSGVQCASGVDMSSEAVKMQIRELIDHESPTAILSDDKLAEMLQERGIDVARRTVAKYREAMGIGSSVERRRQKKLQS